MELNFNYPALVRNGRNKITGRFAEGHVPFNKGKKWTDYMDMRKARKVRRNLELGRVGNPHLAGWNKKPVVAVFDGKKHTYDSSNHAARELGLSARNIRHVCNGKRNSVGGIRFFHFTDERWVNWEEPATLFDRLRNLLNDVWNNKRNSTVTRQEINKLGNKTTLDYYRQILEYSRYIGTWYKPRRGGHYFVKKEIPMELTLNDLRQNYILKNKGRL